MAASIDRPAHPPGVYGLRADGANPPGTSLNNPRDSQKTAASASDAKTPRSPPPPPNPSEDTNLIPKIASPAHADTPSPNLFLEVEHGQLDVSTVPPEAAMKLLAHSVESLASMTGDIPATPAARLRFGSDGILGSQPAPGKENGGDTRPDRASRPGHSRTASKPETPTPVPDHDLKRPSFQPVALSSPEASAHEPPVPRVPTPPSPSKELSKTLSAEDHREKHAAERQEAQTAAIARKFFSKTIPHISLDAYLTRMQRYCPMSTAVWLAAAYYVSVLAISHDGQQQPLVPLTPRTVHRLMLAALRVAMKALEDLRYPQKRFAGVGGVSENELRALEISLCYLMDFELQVDGSKLIEGVASLQRASKVSEKARFSIGGPPGGGFHLMKEGLALRMRKRGSND